MFIEDQRRIKRNVFNRMEGFLKMGLVINTTNYLFAGGNKDPLQEYIMAIYLSPSCSEAFKKFFFYPNLGEDLNRVFSFFRSSVEFVFKFSKKEGGYDVFCKCEIKPSFKEGIDELPFYYEEVLKKTNMEVEKTKPLSAVGILCNEVVDKIEEHSLNQLNLSKQLVDGLKKIKVRAIKISLYY